MASESSSSRKQSESKPTSEPSWATKLVLTGVRNHWLGLLPVTAIRYGCIAYPDWTLNTLGIEPSTLYKWTGVLLIGFVVALVVEKLYLYFNDIHRPEVPHHRTVTDIIRSHWFIASTLMMLQYFLGNGTMTIPPHTVFWETLWVSVASTLAILKFYLISTVEGFKSQAKIPMKDRKTETFAQQRKKSA